MTVSRALAGFLLATFVAACGSDRRSTGGTGGDVGTTGATSGAQCTADGDCLTGNVCRSGQCVAGTTGSTGSTGSTGCLGAGEACQPATPCHVGVVTCVATGGAACTDTGRADPAQDGKSCGGGQVCSSGACGSGGTTTSSHHAFPQVPNNGGSVLAAPDLVTITFDGYPYRADVEGYGDWLMTSSWLAAVGADYGVGKGRHLQKVHLPASALPSTTLTDEQVQSFLVNQFGKSLTPPSGTSPIYAVYLPQGTSISMSGASSCQDFGGYHGEIQSGPLDLAYAVLPLCSSPQGLSDLDYLELAISHEVIEAATDPFRSTMGFVVADQTDPWSYVPGEVGDLCVGAAPYQDSGHTAQRIWSNSAAAAGGDPCVPRAGTEYVNVSPDAAGFVQAAVGSTVKIKLTGWSAGGTTPWALQATPGQSSFMPGFSLDAHSLRDGSVATATFTVPAGTQSGNFATVLILSSTDGFASYNLWPVGVYVP